MGEWGKEAWIRYIGTYVRGNKGGRPTNEGLTDQGSKYRHVREVWGVEGWGEGLTKEGAMGYG